MEDESCNAVDVGFYVVRAILDVQDQCDRMADLIGKVQNGGQLICPGKHDG